MIKYIHTNIVATDWKKLTDFYIKVFNCKPLYPERDLKGEFIDKAIGIKNVNIKGIHLLLPGYDDKGPTLEIFEYNKLYPNNKKINSKGFAHIAFLVDDISNTLSNLLKNGGSQLGKVTSLNIPSLGELTFVYCSDPEGNYIEIQSTN